MSKKVIEKKKFKVGDKIKYTTEGSIGWEEIDEAKQAGIILGETVIVSEVDYGKEKGVKIEESDADTWIHPDHFTAVEKKMFKIEAKTTTYCHIYVMATDVDDAQEQADNIDGGEFITDDDDGAWDIWAVEEVENPEEIDKKEVYTKG